MKILFLHGWHSTPGGIKPTYLKDHGHVVLNPALPDDDFNAAVRIAQAEFDQYRPDVVVGSSRGGAVAMNINAGSTPLVLLCPAWKRWGTAKTVKPSTVILHSQADEMVPFLDSVELVRNSGVPSESLIEVGHEHSLADPESLAKMTEAVEKAVAVQKGEGYFCGTCGKFHAGLPTEFGFDAPLLYETIPADEREARCDCTSDLCVVDKKHFFIRGCLEIRVLGGNGPFVWGVWSSLSEENFKRTVQFWETVGRENEPPYFGWLSTRLPLYPETLSLKTNVHTRPVGQRPFIELEPTDHPLAVEQRNGITMARVREIAAALLHGTTEYPWHPEFPDGLHTRQPVLARQRDWHFHEGKNRAAITTKHVLDGTHPIVLVSHDEEGDWQFLCGTTNRAEDGRIVCLATVVEQHPAVVELADLPVGWQAVRDGPDQPWRRVKGESNDE